MGSIANSARSVFLLAFIVASVLLPTAIKFDDDLLFSSTSVDLADHVHPLKAIARNDRDLTTPAHYDVAVLPTIAAATVLPMLHATPAADEGTPVPLILSDCFSLPLRS